MLEEALVNNFRLPWQGYQCNGINVLLIHDPAATKSSCAISVDVGSIYEPKQAPGLTHLLQHMLFMGSQLYPTPNQFSQFLSEHGGQENAQTCDFFTNYYFQIPTKYFQQAMKRILDAFAHPSFPETCIRSEIEAVQEQFVLSVNDDQSRAQEVMRQFMKDPFNRFVMGNKATLDKNDIRSKLRNFHQEFYAKANICVVLYSCLSIEFMKENFIECLMKLRPSAIHPEDCAKSWESVFNFEVFHENRQNVTAMMRSINNEDTMKIFIPLNLCLHSQTKAFFEKPDCDRLPYLQILSQFLHQFYSCIQYIITHPSQNSLSSYLIQQQISTDVTVQIQQIVPFTQVMIILTLDVFEEWVNKLDKVKYRIMEYLRRIITHENVHEVMKEVMYLSRLEYQNFQVDDMEDFVCDTARNIYQFGLNNALSYRIMATNRLAELENLTRWCIDSIINGKNITIFSSPSQLKGFVQRQPYMGVQYLLIQEKYPKAHPQLAFTYPCSNLPPNPFLPLSQTLQSPPNEPYNPIKIGKNIHFSSAFGDNIKGGIKLIFHYNQSYVFNLLFTQFMDLFLEEIKDVKFAEKIGLDFYFYSYPGMLFLYIFGYSELVVKILKEIGVMLGEFCSSVQKLKNNDDIEDLFDEAVQNVEQDFDNYYQEDMDDLADKIRDQLLFQESLPLHVIGKQLSKIKKNKFLDRAAALLSQSIKEWIVVGNFNPSEITEVIKDFESKLNQIEFMDENKKVKQTKVMNISNLKGQKVKLELRLQADIQTSTCLTYFEAGYYSQQLFWILEILYTYLNESFYNHVRLIKKLSYDFQVNIVNTRGILGICFFMVSSKIDPQLISRQIQKFLNEAINYTNLHQHMQKSLQKIKQSILAKNSGKFATVEDCFDFISDQITNRSYYFEKKNRDEIQQKLIKIKVNHVMDTAMRIFYTGSLSIFLVSKAHNASYSKNRPKVCSLENTKAKADYYKDFLADLDFSFGRKQ